MASVLEPFDLGPINLANRLVMGPMTRARCPSGTPNAIMVEYYAQRASAGLILTEGVWPEINAQGYFSTPGIETDEQTAGWKAVTDNPLGHLARNPWNTDHTPGGSSGGAAVAAALGMGALHVGTDGGGSIRIPASFTGIVGLKPTYGRVPAWPLSPFGTVAHLGPMTRTVEDAALMLAVVSRPDARDWHALPPGRRSRLRRPLRRLHAWRRGPVRPPRRHAP